MSPRLNFSLKSSNEKETESIARGIGEKLTGGEVIELVGDLGAGKTTFVRGLVSGLKTKDVVASPSFTISKVYKTDNLEIHHYDYYRITEPGILANELLETLQNPSSVIVVEWSNIVKDLLPEKRLTVSVSTTTLNGRRLEFRYVPQLNYLMEGLE